MARLQDLHPDQQAVLQLVLGRRMSYADLSQVLGLPPDQVRERALDAVDGLAPDDIDGLALDDRDRIADYLLGQQDDAERDATERLLREQAPAREWTGRLAPQLEPLVRAGLPPLPGDDDAPAGPPAPPADATPAPPADATATGARRAPSADVHSAFMALDADGDPTDGAAGPRRRLPGGRRTWIAAGAAGLVALVVVVLAVAGVFGGGDDDGGADATASATTTTAAADTSDEAMATAVAGALPKQINLTPPVGATGAAAKAIGVGQTNINDNVPGVVFTAQKLPKLPSGRVYAIWVDGGGQPAALLGRLDRTAETDEPLVDAKGSVDQIFVPFATLDPATRKARILDVRQYSRIRLTRETTKATKPGTTVLSGSLKQ